MDQGRLPVQGAITPYTSEIVCVGHRGWLRLTLTAQGESTHTGSAEWSQRRRGVNAVTGLAAVLLRLGQLEIAAPAHPAFEGLRCTLTPGTLFHGGEFESIVPATASAVVDVRLMPAQNPQPVIAAVQAAIAAEESARPGLHVGFAVRNSLPGAAIPVDHRLALIAQRQAETITRRPWPIAGAGPAGGNVHGPVSGSACPAWRRP